jgi:hypothetical protein
MSGNVAASVRARLLNHARARKEEFERTLVRYANERFLYRLGASPERDRCVVKGASLLSVWLRDPHRATRDVDLLALGTTSQAAIRRLVEEVAVVPCADDGLRFDVASLYVETIRGANEDVGTRVRMFAFLDSARIRVQIDFGVGDALATEPEDIEMPTILSDISPPQVRGYSREGTIAEKFHAMVTHDVRNSRMKDFHDVWALSSAFPFDGVRLCAAVTKCFSRRRTPMPQEHAGPLAAEFYQLEGPSKRWSSYLRLGEILIPPPTAFEIIGARVIDFLAPIVRHGEPVTEFTESWSPGGPWSTK